MQYEQYVDIWNHNAELEPYVNIFNYIAHYEFVCLHMIYNAQYSYTCRHIIIFFQMLTNDLIMHNMFLYVDILFHNAHTHFYLCILIMHIYIAQHGSICCI